MKLSTLIMAGLVAAVAIAPSTASAQMQSTQERHDKHVVRTTTTVRTDDGRHDAARDNDRRARHHVRRVCTTQWRHHHRVRVCHTKRW